MSRVFLFIIWPFGVFISELLRLSRGYFTVIPVLFAFLFGFTVTKVDGDLVRFETSFLEMNQMGTTEFFNRLVTFNTSGSNKKSSSNVITSKPDIYALSLSFLISRFSDDPRWFWAVSNSIYWLLIALCLRFIIKLDSESANVSKSILLVMFAFVVPFHYPVIGIRFWPGLLLFVYGSIGTALGKGYKYFLVAFSSVLFHYTFLFPVVLLLLSRTVVSFNTFLIFCSIPAFVYYQFGQYSEVLNFIKPYFESDVNIYSDSSSIYLSEKLISRSIDKKESLNWYVTLSRQVWDMVIFAILISSRFWLQSNKFDKLRNLTIFYLISFLLVYWVGGARYMYIIYMIFLAWLYLILPSHKYRYRFIFSSVALSYLFYIIVVLRAAFYLVNPFLLVSSLPFMFILDSDISLSELLIGH